MARRKRQSNPFSTGGGGPNFETRVQAAFAVLMLTNGLVPYLPSWPISKIKLQGRYAGFNTDDCIIYVRHADSGQEAKMLAQIRRSVVFAESNEAFSEVMAAAWADFNNPDIFKEGIDSIALITGPLTIEDRVAVRPLLELARYCENADEFTGKMDTKGFTSETTRKKLAIIQSQLKSMNDGRDVDPDRLWRFLESFHIVWYDLDSESGSTLSLLKSLLAQNTSGNTADAMWSQILEHVQSADQNAGTITLESIPKGLRCFSGELVGNWASDLEKLRSHGEYILSSIQSDIGGVHVPRVKLLHDIMELTEKSGLILISGGRGDGKSTLAKEFVKSAGTEYPVFCLRTEELGLPHLDHVLRAIGISSSLSGLASGFAMMPKRYLLIESLEKLLELRCKSAFKDLANFILNNPGWIVIATLRDYSYPQITRNLLPRDLSWSSLTVPEFDDDDLGDREEDAT